MTVAMTSLPDKLARPLQAELADGESIRLAVQPLAFRRGRSSALGALFFMAIWTGALMFIMGVGSLNEGPFSLGPMEGVAAALHLRPDALATQVLLYPGVLFGFACMLIFPLLFWGYGSRRARQTVYVVTDRRALVLEDGKVRSFGPTQLRRLEVLAKRDGSGSIHFGTELFRDSEGLPKQAGFFDIPDVRQTERVLRDVVAQMRV
jgi:hypothetical protein